MRILHVFKDVYPPIAGGIERHIDAIRRALPDFEHDVLVCSRERQTRHRPADQTGHGKEVLVGEFGRVLSTPLSPGFPRWLRRLAPGALVHLHVPNPTGEVAALYGLGSSPLIATYHCDIFRQRALLPAYKPLLLRCLSRARVVLVGSAGLARSSPVLRDYSGPIELFPYGVDTEFFDRSKANSSTVMRLREGFGHPHVLAVGRLVAYKGFDRLIEAARAISWPIIIVGDGPERAALAEQISRAGLSDRVHLAGTVDDGRLRDHFAAASLFVMSSVNRAESFGVSLLEAQATGLPVIATDVGTGTAEAFVPGHTGLLVPPGNPDALATSITSLALEPARRAAMSEAGTAWVRETHSFPAMADVLRGVYKRAAESRVPTV
jgi:glycosyltransferase involved in cell wall biosynthesis